MSAIFFSPGYDGREYVIRVRKPWSVDEANHIMCAINEAYSVLSDPVSRAAYDEQNNLSGAYDEGDETADQGLTQIYKDWQSAAEYYPDLISIEAGLARTSKRLAFSYVLVMMTDKAFSARNEIAQCMQDLFLRNYFGDRIEILDFARSLIDSGHKEAAKALNEAILVLGSGLDSNLVINRICSRFGLRAPQIQSSVVVQIALVRELNCPHCRQSLRFSQAGPQKCRCPRCKTTFRIGFDTRVYDVGCAWEGD